MPKIFLPAVFFLLLLTPTSRSFSDPPSDAYGCANAASAGCAGAAIETLQLLRQQVKEEQRKKEQEKMPDVHYEGLDALQDTGRLPATESPCFIISQFELKSDQLEQFPEQFQWALAAINPVDDPATGKCLGTSGIQLIIQRVQNAIIARGFVTTRVLAEPQQLTSGTLVLSIIPGIVHSMYFADPSDGRGRIRNALPIEPGELLNLRHIEHGLENFKRLPSVDADIKIAPAAGGDAKPGASDVAINWQQAFPLRTTVAMDNSGSQATGKYQGNITLAYDHLLTLNDILEVNASQDLGGADAIGTQGTDGYNVHYSLPFDYWMFFMSGGNNDYVQTVAGVPTDNIYSGNSHTADAKLSRLIYRDNNRKTHVSLRAWLRSSKNFINDAEVEVQRRRMAGWEALINHRQFIGRSTLDATLAYKRGTGAFDSLIAPEDAFGEGDSHPKIVNANVQYASVFTIAGVALNYTAVARAQWNFTPLVPQDRFAIGGRYSVRGFDGEQVLSAERGWLLHNDFGYSLDTLLGQSGHELYIGLDAGRVSGGTTANPLPGNYLIGVVLGLRGGYKQFSYDVFVGQPLTKPDNFPTADHAAGFDVSVVF